MDSGPNLPNSFPYKAGAKMCDLCKTERMHIAMGKKGFKEGASVEVRSALYGLTR